jgi:hypothetical protein
MASAGGAAATYLYLKQRRSKEKGEKTSLPRKWECIQLEHHKDIGRRIEEWESNGWTLHTYTTALFQSGVNHYLLFFKEE